MKQIIISLRCGGRRYICVLSCPLVDGGLAKNAFITDTVLARSCFTTLRDGQKGTDALKMEVVSALQLHLDRSGWRWQSRRDTVHTPFPLAFGTGTYTDCLPETCWRLVSGEPAQGQSIPPPPPERSVPGV